MQATTILHPTRQIAGAFVGLLVVVAMIAIVASIVLAAAPRVAAPTGEAALKAWQIFRTGEREAPAGAQYVEQTYREFRAGERGGLVQK